MATNYAYFYAVIRESDGICIQVKDTSDYAENRLWIPIESDGNGEYLLKYYYPIPQYYGDFNGSWYEDAAHTIPWTPPV